VEFSGWTPLDMEGSLRTADLRRMGEGRAEGLHLGAIIRAAKAAAGERLDAPEGDQPGVRVQEGFLFETIVEYLIAGIPFDEAVNLAFKRYCLSLRAGIVKQIALERDGIHGTPDALDPSVPRLESYKSTRRSLRNARTQVEFEQHFWTWVMQEAGYCHMAGFDRVRWIVWWQAGDYSRGAGTGPCVLEATARFTQDEMAANWKGVCAIAERLRSEAAVTPEGAT
jgi:hypothetical protein